jgi:TfoX/Sxy family transcriptional regulator of competence genes
MAYNEKMTARLREALTGTKNVEEKRMFRGATFMVNRKMAMSAGDDEFMFRIDPDRHDEMVEKEGVRAVVMRGREYKGYVRVHEDVVPTKRELNKWIALALQFNAKAKPAPKKPKTPTLKKSIRSVGAK